MTSPQPKSWRFLRRCLLGLAIFLTLIGLFYTEENWRGQSAWEKCKIETAAKGLSLNWSDYVPAPVSDDDNVFGVPEMQKWFSGRGQTDLSARLAYPGVTAERNAGKNPEPWSLANPNGARLVVAELRIDLPATVAASGGTVVRWGDPRAQAQVARSIHDALGPVAMHPGSYNLLFTGRPLVEIQPAQIILECQTAPATNDLLQFLPNAAAITDTIDAETVQLEPVSDGYKVTLLTPESAAEFLKWSAHLQPDFSLVRDALRRPALRMNGDYSAPAFLPIPNFITARSFGQTLSAMTQCHLLEHKPDDALADLTLLHDVCRVFTNRPITLVGSMINLSVAGLYAGTIARGLQWHAWREPQLAALEEQLRTLSVMAPLRESFALEPAAACQTLETTSLDKVVELLLPSSDKHWSSKDLSTAILAHLVPHAWAYQAMIILVAAPRNADSWLDPARQLVFPKQVETDFAAQASQAAGTPYKFLVDMWTPNYLRACSRVAQAQTQVNQALVACALERYRLARGDYPESLDALAPQFISAVPHDVIGGQPLHYRRAAGTFILYSVGWNGTDDGGAPGKSDADGDWVWPPAP